MVRTRLTTGPIVASASGSGSPSSSNQQRGDTSSSSAVSSENSSAPPIASSSSSSSAAAAAASGSAVAPAPAAAAAPAPAPAPAAAEVVKPPTRGDPLSTASANGSARASASAKDSDGENQLDGEEEPEEDDDDETEDAEEDDDEQEQEQEQEQESDAAQQASTSSAAAPDPVPVSEQEPHHHTHTHTHTSTVQPSTQIPSMASMASMQSPPTLPAQLQALQQQHRVEYSVNEEAMAAAANVDPNMKLANSNGDVPQICRAPSFPGFRQSYASMDELRRDLRILSVKTNTRYFMKHSSPQRLEARCPTWKKRKDLGFTCDYVIAANRHTDGKVYLTRANTTHSPNCPALQSASPNVSAVALMETVKPYLRSIKDTNIKPRDMADIMKEQFGVSTSYMTAWRALSGFRQQRKSEESASYMKIDNYLRAFEAKNPGSVTAFEHVPDTVVFQRAFLCPKALQSTLLYCRSSVLLSVFLVVSTHGGILMTATAQDALGEHVPLAIGIVASESEASWMFFLKNLHKAIPTLALNPGTNFVHNRGEDLNNAIASVFPHCNATNSRQGVDAFALNTDAQRKSNSWIEALCAKPPLMILVGWVSRVASLLFQRFQKYDKMNSEYPEELQSLLLRYENEASRYEVLRISEDGFEVIDIHSGRQRIVDFGKQTCTCGEYDVTRFPCLHVLLVIGYAGLSRNDFIPNIFHTSSLKALYSARITPIDVDTIAADGITIPSAIPKQRGRPRKVHQIQQFPDGRQERLTCSLCGVKGHNKRTCKQQQQQQQQQTPSPGLVDMNVTPSSDFLDPTSQINYDSDDSLGGTNAKRRKIGKVATPQTVGAASVAEAGIVAAAAAAAAAASSTASGPIMEAGI